jgi:hypothetical protein
MDAETTDVAPVPELVDMEIWAMVDGAGHYVCHCDHAKLTDEYEKEVGALDASVPTRVIRFRVKVPKPEAVELEAEVAAEPAAGALRAAG